MKKNLNKTQKSILLTGCIFLALIIIFGLGAATYVNGLLGLVDRGEVPGDSNYNETNELTTETLDDTTTNEHLPNGSNNETIITTATTTETTVDPRIIDAKNQQRKALSIPVRSDSQVYNVLLIGSDRRDGETTGRSDSMIILSINKRTNKIHLVSLMRAMYVNIPEHSFNLLNAAYSIGGSRLLRQAIEDNFRVRIDDYIMIDFNGFTTAIDTIGGLVINLSAAEAEELNSQFGTALVEGSTPLDGKMSLAYSRIRYIDSDFVRTSRQRYVIELLFHKAMSLSPTDLDTLARTILPLVKTNMDDSEILGLALGALDYKDYVISQLMIPVKNSYEIMFVNGMEVVKFDYQDNIKDLQKILYDD